MACDRIDSSKANARLINLEDFSEKIEAINIDKPAIIRRPAEQSEKFRMIGRNVRLDSR
jgi:hypothetical protein